MKYFLFVMLLASGCKTNHQSGTKTDFIPDFSQGPPTLVYQTKNNYRDLVPVWLSEDKGRIIGYPGKDDIQSKDVFPLPTELRSGYLLDNRGINDRVAFLKLTYAEYARLETLPSVKEMYNLILDKDPLTSLCDCGSRIAFTDVKKQLNALIKVKQLKTVCHVLK